ncbi:MAG: T9SS type A sorting domain-containing protein, partial [Bacteroidia bacterium]
YYPFYRLLKEELWLIQALSDSTITRINLNTREVTDIPTPKPHSIIHFRATNKGAIGSNSENIVAFDEQIGQFKTLFTVPDGLRIKLPVYGKNKMYFATGTAANARDLYVTDLNSFEIQLVAKIYPTNGNPIPEPKPFPIKVINDVAYFGSPCNGVEWWQSDGTKEGTFCLKDIYEGESSGCFPLMEIDFVNNYLIFTATDASHGTELWKMLVPQPVPEGQGFLLYPNPASEMLSLKFAEQMKEREVRIYNTLGQEMARFMAEEKNVSFPTDALKEGLYYVSVNTPQLIETQKVIIIH